MFDDCGRSTTPANILDLGPHRWMKKAGQYFGAGYTLATIYLGNQCYWSICDRGIGLRANLKRAPNPTANRVGHSARLCSLWCSLPGRSSQDLIFNGGAGLPSMILYAISRGGSFELISGAEHLAVKADGELRISCLAGRFPGTLVCGSIPTDAGAPADGWAGSRSHPDIFRDLAFARATVDASLWGPDLTEASHGPHIRRDLAELGRISGGLVLDLGKVARAAPALLRWATDEAKATLVNAPPTGRA
ncbi:hypothetical protein PAPYR_4524 [Paratrimastix pyriformis]|uniref:Uncharacterized protein n=1 Tax=Paratrimastix pyriformis TaxID=342808 RepID=A0ABQ8UJT4_9EUKA|nr:hypothetical protein PAPYR_4524 [Paratrimastix pyriformis]